MTDWTDPKEAFLKTIGDKRRAIIKNVKVGKTHISFYNGTG